MNLPCNVVEDLLPLYFDSLCSEESAELVEQHLKTCPGCSRMLAQLQTEYELEKKQVDDVKPLAALRERWQKSKWINKKGICITLAAILLVLGMLSCIWYFRYGKVFFRMAGDMERTASGEWVIADSSYHKEVDGYRFDLWFPSVFTEDGYARVMGEDGLGVFIYPEPGGGFSWKLYITDAEGRIRFVYLYADLTPDFESHNTLASAEKEKEKVRQLVAEKEDEILALISAVKTLWGIDLRQYTG